MVICTFWKLANGMVIWTRKEILDDKKIKGTTVCGIKLSKSLWTWKRKMKVGYFDDH